jgi:superfamily II RNA helicase
MTGIPSSFLALALQEPYQGRECRIYFGLEIFLTEIFSGELDQMNIEEAAETSTISVTAENVLIKLERPVVKRYTNQDQKSRYPLDKGLEYIADLQDKELFWGKATPAGQTNTLRSIS